MTERAPCEMCDRWEYLQRHHVFFGGKNRELSEQWGMVAWLCYRCHAGSKDAVHLNREKDLELKRRYQEKFEQEHSREEFMRIFGRNYL